MTATLNPLELSSQFVHRAPDLGYDLTPKAHTTTIEWIVQLFDVYELFNPKKKTTKIPKNRKKKAIHQTNIQTKSVSLTSDFVLQVALTTHSSAPYLVNGKSLPRESPIPWDRFTGNLCLTISYYIRRVVHPGL